MKNKTKFREEELEDEDIYTDEIVEDLLEDDEISGIEAGFMHGYVDS